MTGSPMWTDYSVMDRFETGRVYVVYQDKQVAQSKSSPNSSFQCFSAPVPQLWHTDRGDTQGEVWHLGCQPRRHQPWRLPRPGSGSPVWRTGGSRSSLCFPRLSGGCRQETQPGDHGSRLEHTKPAHVWLVNLWRPRHGLKPVKHHHHILLSINIGIDIIIFDIIMIFVISTSSIKPSALTSSPRVSPI